jgi:hypothetical protein
MWKNELPGSRLRGEPKTCLNEFGLIVLAEPGP